MLVKMVHSRPFGLFILVLCLVACVCAHCDVSRQEAIQSVTEAKKAATKTRKSAGGRLSDAENYLSRVDSLKRRAERLAKEAAERAKGNTEAAAIAQKAKNASDELLKLYPEVSASAKSTAEKMKPLVEKAKALDAKAAAIQIETEAPDAYEKTKGDAEAVKADVEKLDTEIRAASALRPSYDKLNRMSDFADAAQLARYHVDAIVSIAKIDTLLESADNGITLIEQKRDEINGIVQEMKNLFDNSPKNLIYYIHTLYSQTEAGFESASEKVKEAKKVKARMLEQKAEANDALVKVETETDVGNVKDEASDVGRLAKNAEKDVEEIKKALQSATISATNAVYRKQTALNEINKQTTKPVVTEDNKKTNPQDSATTHQPVKATTESPAVIKTKKPTITNPDESTTEETVKDTTESPKVIELKKPTITNPDESTTEQPMQDTTQSPAGSGTKKPTITNPNQKGSGGTEPTQPSSSDGAMTISVPLLLALIACAALH